MSKITKIQCLFLGLILFFSFSASRFHAQESAPNGYDLVAAVNAYRAANGYYQIPVNSLVMSAAQTHAEWIVETGQGGHIGAGGSDETIRVSWTGYGGGASIQCDESWAGGSTVDDAVYGAWSDWVHQEVMLNAWGNRYTDIGGGVASRGDGRYVFVLNVCMVVGQPAGGDVPDVDSPPSDTQGESQPPVVDPSQYIFGVSLATPQADGTIKHKVLYGQTLITIAEAYGTTVNELRTLNKMDASNTVIWPDQELLIKPATSTSGSQAAPTPTPQMTAASTSTAAAPTPTMQRTLVPTAQPTITPTQPAAAEPRADPKAGLMLLAISALALVVLLYLSPIRR
jgi:LysM repeat protein